MLQPGISPLLDGNIWSYHASSHPNFFGNRLAGLRNGPSIRFITCRLHPDQGPHRLAIKIATLSRQNRAALLALPTLQPVLRQGGRAVEAGAWHQPQGGGEVAQAVKNIKTGPMEPRSTVLTASQATMVAFRHHRLLPLGDCLCSSADGPAPDAVSAAPEPQHHLLSAHALRHDLRSQRDRAPLDHRSGRADEQNDQGCDGEGGSTAKPTLSCARTAPISWQPTTSQAG